MERKQRDSFNSSSLSPPLPPGGLSLVFERIELTDKGNWSCAWTDNKDIRSTFRMIIKRGWMEREKEIIFALIIQLLIFHLVPSSSSTHPQSRIRRPTGDTRNTFLPHSEPLSSSRDTENLLFSLSSSSSVPRN